MPQDELQALLQFFKVLADETRLKILGILANGERSVDELAALLQVSAPTVSHHLAKLKELNLIKMRSEGNTHYYSLDAEALRQANKQLLTPEKMAAIVMQHPGADSWEAKVLRDFFEGSRLKEIPASRRKRSVILKWLAEQFQYGVLYKEAQVNEILQRYHEDASSLRRELISSKEMLMQREYGYYWRIPFGENWRSVIIRSADYQPLQAWIGLPGGNGPFPVVLELHEGPELTQNNWLSPLAPLWVQAGFAYMLLSYHNPEAGSYGLSFQERVAGNPGHWELTDLYAAREWLLEQGIADAERILLVGWDYSATMVLLSIGMRPDHWAAGAIAANPVVSWPTAYEMASDKQPIAALFAGTPGTWEERSPVIYADKIQIPLLLLQANTVPEYQKAELDTFYKHLPMKTTARLQRYSGAELTVQQMLLEQESMFEFARQVLLPPNQEKHEGL